jgi:hypothetical protein
LASDTDWGTYPEDPAERQNIREYLHLDNRYLPQGGETCNAAEDAQPFIGCENALQDLAYLRFSVLNIDYQEEVLQGWRAGGCFAEIAQRLGYRIRLIDADLPTQAAAGSDITLNLRLINTGFASPYNPRSFEVILRAADGGAVYRFAVTDQADPRGWLPDQGEFAVALTLQLPADLPPDDYTILLAFPDPQPSLYNRPEYAIRLANNAVWEAETGFNNLGAVLKVSAP